MLHTPIWRVAGTLLLFLGIILGSVQTIAAQTPVSCLPATPELPVVTDVSTVATPAVELPDTDLAWINVQEILTTGSNDLATLALPDLLHDELRSYAEAQIATASSDLTTLAQWRDSLYPDADFPLTYSLATIFQGKMQLDLPAGAGGVGGVGAASAIQQLCNHPADADSIYLQASIDLAQQQIDLAQVASVFAIQPEIAGYADAIIEREQANIGQLLTWQEDWLNPDAATPAA